MAQPNMVLELRTQAVLLGFDGVARYSAAWCWLCTEYNVGWYRDFTRPYSIGTGFLFF